MANYKTHKNIGIITTSITTISILLFKENINNIINLNLNIQFIDILLMFFFGILGSILPDIDLKKSKISQYFRKTTYILTSITFTIIYINYYKEYITNDQMIITGFGIFILIGMLLNFLFIKMFEKFMIHRGIVHSIPYAIVISLLLFNIINQLNIVFNINLNNILISFLLFIGFITHLILDEIYSVDLYNKRLKSSFGTALKLYDKNNIFNSLVLYLILIINVYYILY